MKRVFDDPTLGRFTWHEDLRYWQAPLALPSGRTTNLDISPILGEPEDTPEVFAAAYPIVEWIRASEAEAFDAVARGMLDLYNRTWSEEGPITATEFARRIELVTVWVSPGRDVVNLWFTDGEMEMFGGHDINAWFGTDGYFRDAGLSG